MEPSNLEDLATTVFDAFERHDHDVVENLMHPEATITQNGVSHDWPTMRRRIEGINSVLGDHRYENARRVVGAGAVVEEHDVVATTPDGRDLRLFACVIIRVDDEGLMTEMTEYVDPSALLGSGAAA